MTLQFHNYSPSTEDFLSSIVCGLSQQQKTLSPKWFYDEAGSLIFDEICIQPEYYIPDAEREIFQNYGDEIIDYLGEDCLIIEPGAGSSEKIRYFLNRMTPSMYIPMDISADFLKNSAKGLAQEYEKLDIYAVCVDHTKPYQLPVQLPKNNRVFFYPGSSLGNLDIPNALAFLYDMRIKAGDNGGLLIGIDIKKPQEILNRAYNDAAGKTAAFNLNLLSRIQSEFTTDLDPKNFQHSAFYNESAGRVEMHLVCQEQQHINIETHDFEFVKGETIHTESSYKYSPEEFTSLAKQAGWKPQRIWYDNNDLFSVHYLTASSTG